MYQIHYKKADTFTNITYEVEKNYSDLYIQLLLIYPIKKWSTIPRKKGRIKLSHIEKLWQQKQWRIRV